MYEIWVKENQNPGYWERKNADNVWLKKREQPNCNINFLSLSMYSSITFFDTDRLLLAKNLNEKCSCFSIDPYTHFAYNILPILYFLLLCQFINFYH